jgi:hypothetical protein
MPEPFAHLLYELRDHVAWVTLNRPEKLNAVNPQMRLKLFAAVDRSWGRGPGEVCPSRRHGPNCGNIASTWHLTNQHLTNQMERRIVFALGRQAQGRGHGVVKLALQPARLTHGQKPASAVLDTKVRGTKARQC